MLSLWLGAYSQTAATALRRYLIIQHCEEFGIGIDMVRYPVSWVGGLHSRHHQVRIDMHSSSRWML